VFCACVCVCVCVCTLGELVVQLIPSYKGSNSDYVNIEHYSSCNECINLKHLQTWWQKEEHTH